MASRTQLTVQLINQFEQNLKEQRAQFDRTESSMNQTLKGGFLWDDPIAQNFRRRYDDEMAPLRSELLPAMERYENFLRVLADKTRAYEQG